MAARSLYTAAVESGYALLARVSPLNAWRHFQTLQARQWWSRAELEQLRWHKLKSLLAYAQAEVPFYQRWWAQHDVQPGRFRCLDDLLELPIVKKEDLIAALQADQFRLGGRSDFQWVHTSGTTGPRFRLPFNLADFQIKYASYLRAFYATGWRLGVTSAALHYSGHPEFAGKYSQGDERDTHTHVRKLAFGFAHRRLLLEPYAEQASGNDRYAARWYAQLQRRRPYLLETMDWNLLVLDDYIQRHGKRPLEIPRSIVLGTLSSAQRERLQQRFRSEIFDRYGPHEIEGVAYACSVHRGMHVAIDSVHVEFLDDAQRPVEAGVSGRITLTDLDSRLLPLIRYQIGDHGFSDARPCSCGRGFPLMGEIDGRSRDLFVLKCGKLVPPARVHAVLQDEPEIALFQVTQDARQVIVADIVLSAGPLRESLRVRVLRRLRDLLGEGETISVRQVPSVQLESNGKFCFSKRIGSGAPSIPLRGGKR